MQSFFGFCTGFALAIALFSLFNRVWYEEPQCPDIEARLTHEQTRLLNHLSTERAAMISEYREFLLTAAAAWQNGYETGLHSCETLQGMPITNATQEN